MKIGYVAMLEEKYATLSTAAQGLQRLTAIECKDAAEYDEPMKAFDIAMSNYTLLVAQKLKPTFVPCQHFSVSAVNLVPPNYPFLALIVSLAI